MIKNERPDWGKYIAFGYYGAGGYISTCNGATAEEAERNIREWLKGQKIERVEVYLTDEWEAEKETRSQHKQKGVILGHFARPMGYVERMYDNLH